MWPFGNKTPGATGSEVPPPPGPVAAPEIPPVTTGPVPGFLTNNPENIPIQQETLQVEMPTNPIGLTNVEPGQLVKLDTNKYIVKIVTMGATGNVYELIDLGNAQPLTDKKLTDFQFDNTNPQQNALDIATSPLLGYIEFGEGKSGRISDILKNIDPKLQSYFVIDLTGNAKEVSWRLYPGSEQFDPTNKYIYRQTTSGPRADNIKNGEYITPDTLIKTEKKNGRFRGGGRKTKKYSSGKARKQYTRRSTFHNL
jgi:hypothetical protein